MGGVLSLFLPGLLFVTSIHFSFLCSLLFVHHRLLFIARMTSRCLFIFARMWWSSNQDPGNLILPQHHFFRWSHLHNMWWGTKNFSLTQVNTLTLQGQKYADCRRRLRRQFIATNHHTNQSGEEIQHFFYKEIPSLVSGNVPTH